MSSLQEYFIAYFLPMAGTALATWLTNGLSKLFKSIEEKYKIDIDDALEKKFLHIVDASVLAVEQSYVKALKKKGKLNKTQQKEARDRALRIIKSEIKTSLLDDKIIKTKDLETAVETSVAEGAWRL